MRQVSSQASTWAPRAWLTIAVCAMLACLAWSASALASSAPTVEEEFATDVASSSATLHAKIDPGGEETTYRFEYGTTEAYGSSAPVPDGLAGSAEGATSLEVHIQGLATHTTYHYRVVAHNALGTVDGKDLTFTTQTTGSELVLPDNRQWEMVTPPDKHGAKIETISEIEGLIQAAANGDAVTYVSIIPMEAEPWGFAQSVQNLALYKPGGWESHELTVPHGSIAGATQRGPEYRFFSSDLSHAIVQPLGPFTGCRSKEGAEQPCLSPEASEQTAFLATDFFNDNVQESCIQKAMHCDRPLVSGCPKAGEPCARIVEEHADVPPGTVFGGRNGGEEVLAKNCVEDAEGSQYCGPQFIAATPDLSHVVLEAEAVLAPGATPGFVQGVGSNLYEWSGGKLIFIGKGVLGGRSDGESGISPVSDDGSRVVFHGEGEGLKGLLMRDTGTGETIDLAAGLENPSFDAANTTGSRVFLTSEAGGGELYVFEVSEASGLLTGKLRDLTSGAGIEGNVLGVSEDGSYVYFVSGGVLAGSGASGPGDNLYVDHYEGSGWKPTFIATLSAGDATDWRQEQPLAGQPTRVSSNGDWLVFMSQAQLTGYDNRDAVSGRTDAEVYLYDAGTNRLVCASCDPTGARPVGVEYRKLYDAPALVGGGKEVWPEEDLVAANITGWQETRNGEDREDYSSRFLSNSGRLFFDSGDSLVPQDVNGTEDVYEYEPAGVGGCTTSLATYSAQDGGCVGLISSGISAEESAVLDASEGGGNVFFLSSAQLVPQDVETSPSLYDARECTVQVPCVAPAVSPPPCETEASCRPAPSPQPAVFGAPASATLSAEGNIATSVTQPTPVKGGGKRGVGTRACAKGKRLQRGHCVKVRSRRAGRHRSVTRAGRKGR